MAIESASDLASFFNPEEFGEVVTFQPQARPAVPDVPAVRGLATVKDFPKIDQTLRTVAFDLPMASVATRPRKDDVVAAADGNWSIIQVADAPERGAWAVAVEQVPA